MYLFFEDERITDKIPNNEVAKSANSQQILTNKYRQFELSVLF